MLNLVNGYTNIGNCVVGTKKTPNKCEKINELHKGVQELFHPREAHTLNSNLCVKFVKPFIFTSIQRVKLGCCTKVTLQTS